jgi:stage II sporulation protein D
MATEVNGRPREAFHRLLAPFVAFWCLLVPSTARPTPHHTIRIGIAGTNGAITKVKRLDVEKYLLGVLPQEMAPEWPIEALKAQAVVARTYAYSQLGRFGGQGFDLTSDTRSQVYKKPAAPAPLVRRAVTETAGEVLGWRGKLLGIYYHACCGGHTTSPNSAWGYTKPAPPPLRGVADRYCRHSPYAHWSSYVSAKDLLASLGHKRLLGATLRSFSIAAKDRAGYALWFKARIGGRTLRFAAYRVRQALGNALPSLRIMKIRRSKAGYEFFGEGLGHGVGLCQWGARGMADRGYRYEAILKHYFPGSVLSVVVN